jgi:hypothetical protein
VLGSAARERAILTRSLRRRGGAHLRAAGKAGFDDKPGSRLPPRYANGRGIADAWAACCDQEALAEDRAPGHPGDEAAADPNVRAGRAERVLVTSMFQGLARAGPTCPSRHELAWAATVPASTQGRLQRL